jgi:AmmeMemoRadiSam system protein B
VEGGGAIRRPAVAGSWYPDSPRALEATVDRFLAAADRLPAADRQDSRLAELVALIAPHAGLKYSGPVAAHAYNELRGRDVELVVLVGPSHFVRFEGIGVYPRGGFDTPLGVASIDEECAAATIAASSLIRDDVAAHAREHSLEMQLPFVLRLLPRARILPLLMGTQDAATANALAAVLADVLRGRRAVLVASTDLSHYHDAATAACLDAVVMGHVSRFDPDGLDRALAREPGHACGGGPTVAVMRAARLLGARDARVLQYSDSGDVSGDKSSVVGYMAAALGHASLNHGT